MTDETRNATMEPITGADITGTSDAIEMASAPDVALPLETERGETERRVRPLPAADWFADMRDRMHSNPGGAMAVAAAAGLLVGIGLKKSLPARKRHMVYG